MIDNDIIRAALLALSMVGPAGSSLDPDKINLTPYQIDGKALAKAIDSMVKYEKPNKNRDKHDPEWWFRHGILVGFVLGATTARIENTQTEQIAAINWQQFDFQ